MLRKKKKLQMLEEFKKTKSNITYVIEDNKKKMTRGFDNVPKRGNARSGKATTSHYDRYKYKLDKGNIESFNTRDILYFFKDLADENGCNYVIPNFQVEMAKVKNILNKGYSPTDVVAMIEFLFTSGQTYLELKRLTPGILATGWCNRIYNDTQDWLEDNYDPNKDFKKSTKNTRTREWVDDEGDEW